MSVAGVLFTHGTSPCEQIDSQTRLKTLPACKFVMHSVYQRGHQKDQRCHSKMVTLVCVNEALETDVTFVFAFFQHHQSLRPGSH